MTKIEESFILKGKVAIVTGAAAGIGKASAIMLARAGAKVVCSDLNLDNAQEVVKEIKKLGGEAIAVKCDVTSEAELESLVKNIYPKYLLLIHLVYLLFQNSVFHI